LKWINNEKIILCDSIYFNLFVYNINGKKLYKLNNENKNLGIKNLTIINGLIAVSDFENKIHLLNSIDFSFIKELDHPLNVKNIVYYLLILGHLSRNTR
jgi:hypothetical protein